MCRRSIEIGLVVLVDLSKFLVGLVVRFASRGLQCGLPLKYMPFFKPCSVCFVFIFQRALVGRIAKSCETLKTGETEARITTRGKCCGSGKCELVGSYELRG